MIRILVVLIVVALTACSIGAEIKAENNLYSTYSEYAANFKNKSKFSDAILDNVFSYISPRYQEYLLSGRKRSPEVLAGLINKTLDLPNNYQKEIAHYEKHDKDYSCLLINALNKDNKKVALYIKYINPENWLIDNIIIEFINEGENFLKVPICDSWKLQQKRMESWGN